MLLLTIISIVFLLGPGPPRRASSVIESIEDDEDDDVEVIESDASGSEYDAAESDEDEDEDDEDDDDEDDDDEDNGPQDDDAVSRLLAPKASKKRTRSKGKKRASRKNKRARRAASAGSPDESEIQMVNIDPHGPDVLQVDLDPIADIKEFFSEPYTNSEGRKKRNCRLCSCVSFIVYIGDTN